MARAEVASASVSSDSIKGLAQSIAKPAYRRLLTAEPALRRAVPALILAYLFRLGLQIVAFLGWFYCLVTGRMSGGLQNLGTYCLRYETQTYGYLLLLTSRYPSLSGIA